VIYFLFDTIQLVFSFAIIVAGDTLFVLIVAATVSVLGVLIGQQGAGHFGPLLGGEVYWWWYVMTGWIVALAVAYFVRFESGAWRKMRVIEKQFLKDGAALVRDVPEGEPVYEAPEAG
jgi:MATE family multidrug resistance protein